MKEFSLKMLQAFQSTTICNIRNISRCFAYFLRTPLNGCIYIECVNLFSLFTNVDQIYQNYFWQSVNDLKTIKNKSSWFIFYQNRSCHQIFGGFFCGWIKNKHQKTGNSIETKFSSINSDFCITPFRLILPSYIPWKH